MQVDEIVHVSTQKSGRGWVVVIDDTSRKHSGLAAQGYYVNAYGQTGAQLHMFSSRRVARAAIEYYNKVNYPSFKLVGGLH